MAISMTMNMMINMAINGQDFGPRECVHASFGERCCGDHGSRDRVIQLAVRHCAACGAAGEDHSAVIKP